MDPSSGSRESARVAGGEPAKVGLRIGARDVSERAFNPRRELTISRQQRDRAGADVIGGIAVRAVRDRIDQRVELPESRGEYRRGAHGRVVIATERRGQ